MRTKYNLVFEFKTGNSLQSVRNLENELNESMSGFGFHEKVFSQSQLSSIEMTTDRALLKEEQNTVVVAANKRLIETESPFRCVRMEFAGLEEICKIE